MLTEINGEECYKVLDQDKYIFFYFGASWCGPCQQVQKKINDLSNEYDSDKISFYKIDIDDEKNNNFSNSCQIKVIPAFILFNGRNFIDRKKGNNIPGVKEMINSRLYPPIQYQQGQIEPSSYSHNMAPSQIQQNDPYKENRKLFDKSKLFQ